MTNPEIPTANNPDRNNLGWEILKQVRGIASGVYSVGVRALPSRNNPDLLLVGRELLYHLKHIGDNVHRIVQGSVGASASYAKTADGVQTLLAADPDNDRLVILTVIVDEVFADGDGGQTVFEFGEEDTDDKFDDGTGLADAAAGSVHHFAGVLSAEKDLIVTAAAATGTGTGGITVIARVVPAP